VTDSLPFLSRPSRRGSPPFDEKGVREDEQLAHDYAAGDHSWFAPVHQGAVAAVQPAVLAPHGNETGHVEGLLRPWSSLLTHSGLCLDARFGHESPGEEAGEGTQAAGSAAARGVPELAEDGGGGDARRRSQALLSSPGACGNCGD